MAVRQGTTDLKGPGAIIGSIVLTHSKLLPRKLKNMNFLSQTPPVFAPPTGGLANTALANSSTTTTHPLAPTLPPRLTNDPTLWVSDDILRHPMGQLDDYAIV